MAALGLWLFALGLSDVAFGLLVGRRASLRLFAAVAVAALGAGAGALGVSFPVAPLLALVAWAALTAAAWQGLRGDEASTTPRSAVAALALLALCGLATFLSAGMWPEPASGVAARFLRATPSPVVARMTPGRLVLTVGVLTSLVETANVVVRLVLIGTGVSAGKAGVQLRGGRILGPIERLLIFGLGVAGELAGAALVASAKSVLRFPEISRASRPAEPPAAGADRLAPDEISEYVLIGSLVSWFLALVPVLLFAG